MGHRHSRQRPGPGVNSTDTSCNAQYACVICGAVIHHCSTEQQHEMLASRDHWRKEKLGIFRRSISVPASEVEGTYLASPLAWSYLFRVLLQNPETEEFTISGIATIRDELIVPKDPATARIASTGVKPGQGATLFRPVDVTGGAGGHPAPESVLVAPSSSQSSSGSTRQILREKVCSDKRARAARRRSCPRGHLVHADCWLLVDRVIGHDLVTANVRLFVETVRDYWRSHGGPGETWAYEPAHHRKDVRDWGKRHKCDGWRTPKFGPDAEFTPRPGRERCMDNRYHQPRSPVRIPEIQALVDSVVKENEDTKRRSIHRSRDVRVSDSAAKIDIPVDIAMMILDYMYHTYDSVVDMIRDTRNLLEAFSWTLPDAYWISRCAPWPLFEIVDIPPGGEIDWVALCLGLEELLVEETWYCRSGLKLRATVLRSLEAIRVDFVRRLEGKARAAVVNS
ncbi:uncharacterized protein DSM5745_03724 [Aspergillus mulundensis]|uniref:Uncharacterized protein n=1 Tax=Aspergillus mulundensis TaxID=1810919 RepID=A0A3D8SLE6_9EURO|nr:hypothetical protein DSM5745_03724 [Aspergillus mulundensis]RDW87082.1 hypothetical protein DSM5745_03724 [Aspergillus mulundensis]